MIGGDTAESYRKEWAVLTGKDKSEIYVPRHLREQEEKERAFDAALELLAKLDETIDSNSEGV